MNKTRLKSLLWLMIGSSVLIFADQFTKYLTLHYLKNTSGVVLIPGVFEFQYVENRGAAFGILQQKRFLLILISVAILGVLYFFYRKFPEGKRYLPLRILSVLLVSGALGNMIDRIFRGFVVDFFYFKLINFPVFNIADCYVVISVIVLFFLFCFYYSDEELDSFGFSKKSEKKSQTDSRE